MGQNNAFCFAHAHALSYLRTQALSVTEVMMDSVIYHPNFTPQTYRGRQHSRLASS